MWVFNRTERTVTELTPEAKSSDAVVPEGIQKARAAFLRDFPALMADRRTRGKYVCYHNDARVAVAKDYVSIVRKAIELKIPEDASLFFKVDPDTEFFERIVAVEGELP